MEKDYSAIRKKLQEQGEVPSWFTTGGYQLFSKKYAYKGETVKSRFLSIAKALAQHAPKVYPEWWSTDSYTQGKDWEQVFFDVLWDNYICSSTPLYANGGLRKRGTTVSCAGGNVGDNLFDRYNAITEAAILTKHSHGTSYSINDWPCEGEALPRGGYSLGTMPLIRDLIATMNEVTQGSRRGSLAYSIKPQHGDFHKVLKKLHEDTESNNVGWLIDDEFVRRSAKVSPDFDPEFLDKFADILGVKLPRGKGYFTFIDKMNRHLAHAFKRKGMTLKASNLCQETCLPSDTDYTFSCVILNVNLEMYNTLPEHLYFIAGVMSDCNITEYLATIDEMSEMDKIALRKIRKFTEEFRALGTGVMGFHTLLQMEMLPVSSLGARALNREIFKKMNKGTLEASQWLAKVLGEPEGCKGLGIRNATRMMMPPTKSTAELAGGASEGIGLDTAMAFTKQSAGGEFFRVNKVLLKIIKERGLSFDDCVKQIIEGKGSVQQVDWLTVEEKEVFLTAFEIRMEDHLTLCAERQPEIDQAQSINLYFTSNDSEEYISKIHRIAFEDERILSLYYIYSMRGAGNITRNEECAVCQ